METYMLAIIAVVIVLVIVAIWIVYPIGGDKTSGGVTSPAAAKQAQSSKWDLVRARGTQTNEEWARKIFGLLRVNPGQEMEGAIYPLLPLLENKQTLDAAAAIEFGKAAFFWYPSLVPNSGMYNAQAQTLVGF